MASSNQEHAVKDQDVISPSMGNDDRIVISGMSGLYPKSHNIQELSNILYNKENPVTTDSIRWKYSHPEAAQYSGSIPELDRFDAQFFKVHYRLGNSMDPTSRKILEQAHNDIYDAVFFHRIQDLEGEEIVVEDVKGLGAFFSRTESDDITATAEMLHLPTMAGSKLRDDEFDTSQSNIFIVPGMEGQHERFQRLCERLKLSAFVLQPGLDHPHETVYDTAKRFAELLVKRAGLKDDFYLLGYESGIFVALEMARIFEEQGMTGTVYCIGYAPDEFKTVIEVHLSEYKTEEQLQDAVVLHIFKLMTDKDTAELHKALEKARTWREKIKIGVQLLKGHVSHSLQYISTFIDAALLRIEQARRYKAEAHPLRSRLVLLRPATQHDSPTTTSLQQHSQQPVVVHQLRLPLAHAAQDARCAAIINRYLHPQILLDFENKNICEAYLTNLNCFMAKEQV